MGSALLFSSPLLAGTAEAAKHAAHGSSGKPAVSLHLRPVASRSALAAHPLAGTHPGFAAHSAHGMHSGYGTHLAYGAHSSFGARISYAIYTTGHGHGRKNGRRFATRSYGISCVPYAREVSGIEVAGNAWQWWDNAQGLYARGDQPETGSVLNFRANGRMRLGHVAVVTQVVNEREVIVDQANWPSGAAGRGGVSHGVTVVDVSEANNWSAVRVELGRGGDFGSVYPTYGFIYNRPDNGIVAASASRPAPQAAINRVPSDLRPVAEQPWHTTEEVAEYPSPLPRRIDLRFSTDGSGQ